jgi:hypothetical protein
VSRPVGPSAVSSWSVCEARAKRCDTAQRSGDIAERLKVKVQRIAPVRNGLIKKGMIYSPAHGDTAFTVPLFSDFMKRTMPANH